jgi:hypothetical protein
MLYVESRKRLRCGKEKSYLLSSLKNTRQTCLFAEWRKNTRQRFVCWLFEKNTRQTLSLPSVFFFYRVFSLWHSPSKGYSVKQKTHDIYGVSCSECVLQSCPCDSPVRMQILVGLLNDPKPKR